MSTYTYIHIAQKRKIYMNVHIIHKAGTSPQVGESWVPVVGRAVARRGVLLAGRNRELRPFQRGGGAALRTRSIRSVGVWRTMRAALASRLLRRSPPTGWAGGGGVGLRAAVAGQDSR